MTLADLAAVLGLAALAVIYVGFRLGERGGCPGCGGPGSACETRDQSCAGPEEADGAPGSGRVEEPIQHEERSRR